MYSSVKGSPLGLIGLARRAGMVEQGVFLTRRALSQGRASLVLMARDGSEIQKEKISRVLRHKSVPVITWGTCEDLGAILGGGSVTALAVTDRGMAKRLIEELPGQSESKCVTNSARSGK